MSIYTISNRPNHKLNFIIPFGQTLETFWSYSSIYTVLILNVANLIYLTAQK